MLRTDIFHSSEYNLKIHRLENGCLCIPSVDCGDLLLVSFVAWRFVGDPNCYLPSRSRAELRTLAA